MIAARIPVALLPLLVFASAPASADDPVWKAEVLAANESFYRAFRNGDLPAMDDLWGQREPITMDHPRGDHFDSRESVMKYWQWALPGSSPDISCDVTGVLRQGDSVVVYCKELLFQGSLLMKNIFRQEGGVWKMIYHGPPQQQGLS